MGLLHEIRTSLHKVRRDIYFHSNRRDVELAIYMSCEEFAELERESYLLGYLAAQSRDAAPPEIDGAKIYRVLDDLHGWKITEIKGGNNAVPTHEGREGGR